MQHTLVHQHPSDRQLLGERRPPPGPRLGPRRLGLAHTFPNERELLGRRPLAPTAHRPVLAAHTCILTNPTDNRGRPSSPPAAARTLPWATRPHQPGTSPGGRRDSNPRGLSGPEVSATFAPDARRRTAYERTSPAGRRFVTEDVPRPGSHKEAGPRTESC
ncbi:hypothetical protein SNL152K_8466 [Streptomyces sp. NL15-2K]|nr:hypothetical protein SNL152K_8466 [Streptomyces sp. NL15-2K]